MIEVYNIVEQLDYVIGDLRYTFSSWASQTVDATLYSTQACNLMGATDSVYSTQGNTISCHRPGGLTNGPDQYNGIYSIANPADGSVNKVCISDQDSACDVCNKLGYDQYTTSIYTSATALATTKVPVSNTSPIQLSSSIQSCTYRISCRDRCTELTLLNGNNCYSNCEGESCYFSCNAGYAMIGSSSRTCTSNGTHPFCDGEAWKQDIDSQSQTHSGKSHYDLADHLKTFLQNKYSNVYCVAVVYDAVTGSEAHTVQGSYYHHFRHCGHNIVVGRVILPSPRNEPSDLSGKFQRAYTPTFDYVCNSWCWYMYDRFNSAASVGNTWSRLIDEGLYPVMLHMFTSGIGSGIAHYFDGRLLIENLYHGGYATLIAEEF